MTNKIIHSKFNKILLLGIQKNDLDKKDWPRINRLANKTVVLPKDSPEIEDNLKDTDCLLVNQGMLVDKKIIKIAAHLEYIGIMATGYNRIDTSYATSQNITVCNIPGYATESVAEFVFGLILEHMHNLEKAKQAARNGDFTGDGFQSYEIKGKKFGIIGLGRIGKRVAEIASVFGAEVVYWSRKRKKDMETKGIRYLPIKTLISTCDFLTLHISKTKTTEGILNDTLIKTIKPGSLLMNVSPMELINVSSLVKRLKKNDITFIFDHPDEMAVKDVKELMHFKNCIAYPPVGFITKEAKKLKQEIFVSNVEYFLKGKPLNKVN